MLALFSHRAVNIYLRKSFDASNKRFCLHIFVFLYCLCYNVFGIDAERQIILRIIAGSAKKRVLKVPSGWTGRPTADRNKESLFNILGSSVIDCRFLDLFAGTGNVGIEALSRGAEKAYFVEKDPRAIQTIIHNLKITGMENCSRILMNDIYKALNELSEKGVVFDIIFLDPPYDCGFEFPVIKNVLDLKILSPGGRIIAESSKRTSLPSDIAGCVLLRQEKYGDTMFSFYQ